MARLRQQYPNNYHASGNISADFENIIRYLVAAERGDKTLGEMLRIAFDEDGNLRSNVELRQNDTGDIEYRVGSYDKAEEGWSVVVAAADLRGEPGSNIGSIPLPVIHSRGDYTATGGQTVFSYSHDATDGLLVYKNGILLREGALFDYTHDAAADTITLTSGAVADDDISAFRLRADGGATFARTFVTPLGPQVVFPYVFPTGTYQLFIYKNGILLQEGGAEDYIASTALNTITFTSTITTADTITFLLITPTGEDTVPGIMLEGRYTNPATGLIDFDQVEVEDETIPPAKVIGLADFLDVGGKIVVSSTTPVDADTKTLWLDTSQTPNQLKFYDGSQFISTSPESALPILTTANAGMYIKVNGTGTGLIYDTIDFSALVARNEMGSSNGVATLDSTGRIPVGQLPDVKANIAIHLNTGGATANGAYTMQRLYGVTYRVVGISVQTTSGTCQVQLKVAGVLLGNAYAVSSSTSDQTLTTPIEIDAETISKTLAVEVTNSASAAGLDVTLAIEVL